jgi:hypothetical protein
MEDPAAQTIVEADIMVHMTTYEPTINKSGKKGADKKAVKNKPLAIALHEDAHRRLLNAVIAKFEANHELRSGVVYPFSYFYGTMKSA